MSGIIVQRTVFLGDTPLQYTLERKNVKNLNLHVRKDGSVYVSANVGVQVEKIEEFLVSKESFILNAQRKFSEMEKCKPLPKQYVSGETFYIQGRAVRLKVEQAVKESVSSDGVYLFLAVKDPMDTARRERLVTRFLDRQCKEVFSELIGEIYPIFQKYGVAPPVLRIRNMDTRWGSCLPGKGIITLNKRLLEAPRNCIEYVVMHELVHLRIHNHSLLFERELDKHFPRWREVRSELNSFIVQPLP